MPLTDAALRTFFRRTPVVRTRALEEAGIARIELTRLVAAGRLIRAARGVYTLPDRTGHEHATLAVIAQRAPQAVLCLLTALRLHELTTQAPHEVWIAIGSKARAPTIDYPPLRVVRVGDALLRAGVQRLTVDGTPVRVTNVARTVADCFKFRHKIGLDVALEALREARREKKVTADDLWRYAKLDRVTNVMRPYLEALS